ARQERSHDHRSRGYPGQPGVRGIRRHGPADHPHAERTEHAGHIGRVAIMSTLAPTTLTRFLIEEQRRHEHATGNFTALVNDVRLACKRIATLIGKGALSGAVGYSDSVNVQGETQTKLDVLANDIFIRTNEW